MQPLNFLQSPIVQSALDFVFPPLCLGCGLYFDNDTPGVDTPICPKCDRRIEALRFDTVVCAGCGGVMSASQRCPECGPGFWPLFAFGNYHEPLKDIVLHFKFKGITSPAHWAAPRLVAAFHDELLLLGTVVLIPIPLYPGREYYRGYNQARVFADALGRALNRPVAPDLLLRTKRRRPQSRIDHRHREENVHGVFTVAETARSMAPIILIDDVVTTGATVREARRTLERAGYQVVAAIAIAHGV